MAVRAFMCEVLGIGLWTNFGDFSFIWSFAHFCSCRPGFPFLKTIAIIFSRLPRFLDLTRKSNISLLISFSNFAFLNIYFEFCQYESYWCLIYTFKIDCSGLTA